MKIISAWEIIRDKIPNEIADKIREAISHAENKSDLDLKYFSLWKVEDFDTLLWKISKRLKANQGSVIYSELEQKLDFLNDANSSNQREAIYQASLIHEKNRTSFLINVAQKKFIKFDHAAGIDLEQV